MISTCPAEIPFNPLTKVNLFKWKTFGFLLYYITICNEVSYFKKQSLQERPSFSFKTAAVLTKLGDFEEKYSKL